MSVTRAYFGEFNLPVKASRIKRAKKYSDVKITRPGVGETTVKAQRPVRGLSGYEPEEVTRMVLK